VIWRPQPGPQTALLTCPLSDVFYGGARGGGKTDGALGDWIAHAGRYGRAARGIFFRRSYPELEEVERRARELFAPLGATERQDKHYWLFPNGATLKMRFLERDKDAAKYQGHAYTWMAFDELPNWPSPAPIDLLWGSLRSADGVPCTRRCFGNPGGPGHNWVKARYIDRAPPYMPFTVQPQADRPDLTIDAVFIPARLEDNPLLVEHDPGYEARIAAASGGGSLWKGWRYGDWDIVAGGFFDDVWDRTVHVLRPFAIPSSWRLDRAFDWGSAKPFSVGWWAESDGSPVTLADGSTRTFPARSLIRIAEWYGWNGQPNHGLRLSDEAIARGILERERQMGILGRVHAGPADSMIFEERNGDSPAAIHQRLGVRWEKSIKGPGSRQRRWQMLRDRLIAARDGDREHPGLWVFETCTQWIRTVPVLPRDETTWDDIDTEAEDHAADETGYRVATQDRRARSTTIRM
jgi:hypothetical protein